MDKSEAGKLGAIKSTLLAKEKFIKNIEKYLLDPIFCKHCKSVIPYEKRSNLFCNHSCSASYNNVLKEKKSLGEKQCLVCLTIFKPVRNSSGNYCCFECSAEHKVKLRIDEWLNGGKVASKTSIKHYLLEAQKNKCASCGIENIWNNKPIVFDLEHKDGNSDNNVRDNLELICPNCHSQTDTYKGKNKGNGRFIRMQRYYSNQSY